MIFDHLSELNRYRAIHPLFPIAFDFLKNFDPNTPDGRYPLDGDKVFALVQSYEPLEKDGRPFEAHRRYIDLQYIAEGEEVIYHSPLSRLSSTIDYSEEKDCEMLSGAAEQALIMTPGTFTILFPHDAHLPSCLHRCPDKVKKVVIKIRCE